MVRLAFGIVAVAGLAIVGCAKPEKGVPTPVPPRAASNPLPKEEATPAPDVRFALLEPMLVVRSEERLNPSPPRTLGGDILPSLPVLPPVSPLVPPAPEPAKPTEKPAPVASAPVRPRPFTVPPAVVRLFEEERGRTVEEARRRQTAASTRAVQTATEAKRLAGYVKDGFVAQKQADAADAAARAANAELAEAQRALDAATARQRDARRDVEAAAKSVASLTAARVVRVPIPTSAYRPLPDTFRLSVLGGGELLRLSLQNGTALKRLAVHPGEAAAWLVRCSDPTRLRVGYGGRATNLLVRPLPTPETRPKV